MPEITLTARARVVKSAEAPRRPAGQPGSAGRATAGAVSIGSAVGAAMTGRRALGPAEARIMGMAGLVLLVLGLLALVWPWVIAAPLAVVALWLAVGLLVRARALHRESVRRRRRPGKSPA